MPLFSTINQIPSYVPFGLEMCVMMNLRFDLCTPFSSSYSHIIHNTHTLTHTYKPKQHKEEQKSNVEAANSWRSFLNIIIAWHYQSVTRYLFATFGTLFCEAFHSLFFSHFLAFSFSLSIAILIFRCLFSMLFDVLCCSKCYWCSDSFSYFRFISSNVGGKVCLLL